MLYNYELYWQWFAYMFTRSWLWKKQHIIESKESFMKSARFFNFILLRVRCVTWWMIRKALSFTREGAWIAVLLGTLLEVQDHKEVKFLGCDEITLWQLKGYKTKMWEAKLSFHCFGEAASLNRLYLRRYWYWFHRFFFTENDHNIFFSFSVANITWLYVPMSTLLYSGGRAVFRRIFRFGGWD